MSQLHSTGRGILPFWSPDLALTFMGVMHTSKGNPTLSNLKIWIFFLSDQCKCRIICNRVQNCLMLFLLLNTYKGKKMEKEKGNKKVESGWEKQGGRTKGEREVPFPLWSENCLEPVSTLIHVLSVSFWAPKPYLFIFRTICRSVALPERLSYCFLST